MKVRLEKQRPHWQAEGSTYIDLNFALPFFFSPSRRVHRPRSARMHYQNGIYTYTAIQFWCGSTGFISGDRKNRGNKLTENPPRHYEVCATCEGRAIGAGQLGSRKVAERIILFTPQSAA